MPREFLKRGFPIRNGGETPAYEVEAPVHIKSLPFPLDHDIGREAASMSAKGTSSYLFRDMHMDMEVGSPEAATIAEDSYKIVNGQSPPANQSENVIDTAYLVLVESVLREVDPILLF